ncbi:MAG: hypothetical protein HYR85_24550 [Planctomycetes bacterium]|nr:hypothetical protein [Planctomycetota bacterium]MBI3845777.1 hypothetical protein [Planctomycetota bacterium]
MTRDRKIAASFVVAYLVVATTLFVLVFRTTGILWWRFEIGRRIDPPATLVPQQGSR